MLSLFFNFFYFYSVRDKNEYGLDRVCPMQKDTNSNKFF